MYIRNGCIYMNKTKMFNLLKPKNLASYVILLIFSVITLQFNKPLGMTEIGIVVVMFLFQQVFNISRNKKINEYLKDLFLSSDSITKDFVVNSILPLVILKENSSIIWYNNKFADIFYDDGPAETDIKALIKNFPSVKEGSVNGEINIVVDYNGRKYNVIGNQLKISSSENKTYSMLYFVDVTAEYAYKKELKEKQIVYAKIVIDNYDEVIGTLSESQRAVLVAETDKHIFSWAQKTNSVIIKQERDKYRLFFEKIHLDGYLKNGFESLRDIKFSDMENSVHLTFSIGVGYGGASPVENEEFTSSSIDMALGRGGDQVVIKNKDGFTFHGGASKEVERRSKVRSRVVSLALKELIESKESVVITGHIDPDFDSLGSALGIYRAVKTLGKACYIVLEDSVPAVRDIVKEMESLPEYEGVIINKYQAESYLDGTGMLIIADTHRKSLLAYPELIEETETLVIIDHHRKSTDFIENATLTYHEPYASSTAELVIEILQYMEEKIKLTPTECKALYAGMLVDTKNFTFKTGVRTFEAASYLRRSGLDTAHAKELVKCDLSSYKIKSRIINDAVIYKNGIAISKYDAEEIEDTAVIAQAADELINIKGITTTFVIYYDGDGCRISARSIGTTNVQVIMEKMGGGGHQLSAGAQLATNDIEKVADELMEHIDEYLKG